MNNLSSNIKKVLIVFLVFFICLISYVTYFEVFVGPKIVSNPSNKRLWAKRNEVLRGTIYDRNKKPLTKSTRINELTQKREYLGGELFAHALGYVDIKYGITGLEKKYDAELMGDKTQSLETYIESKGSSSGKVGNSLVTTLDYKIQRAAFDAIGDRKGAVVALNPKTGEVLALVSKPTFNPNNLKDTWKKINADKDRPLLNRVVSGLYPPGSTFKTVIAVSALENIPGIMNRTFEDNGKLVLNSKYSISNFQGESFGNIGFKDAYIHSSNVVFGTLGLDLGNDKLKETAEKFYFNKEITTDGIPVDESKFPSLNSYEKGNIAQSAIGQGSVLATPLQMALVASTIANDGKMMTPMIVKQVLSKNGDVLKNISSTSLGTIMTKDNAKIMQNFMKGVVSDGTGGRASVEGVTVCGKTGTADHAKVAGEEYSPHSWFIGFAPYENPQVAIAVLVENGGQGGKVAAQIASQVIEQALRK